MEWVLVLGILSFAAGIMVGMFTHGSDHTTQEDLEEQMDYIRAYNERAKNSKAKKGNE